MVEELPRIREVIEGLPAHDTVVLCGMGGSSLAPEVFSRVFGLAGRLLVCDSTHPEAVSGLLQTIDPGRSVYLVASKSGTTLETLSFYRTFWASTGGDGRRFVALTDPGTPLERLAWDRDWRAVVRTPPDVGGRFSALTPFGLLPAALIGIDPERLLGAAAELASGADGSVDSDPGVPLGLAWASLALGGRDKLTIVTSPSLGSFPAWLEQLVAESLGKEGTGIVPVPYLEGTPMTGVDRAYLVYRLVGEEVPEVPEPRMTFELADRYRLGAEMLRAELATATAGEVLAVNPFDQPNVEAAKKLARKAMEDGGGTDRIPALAAGDPSLIRDLEQVKPPRYVAVQAFLPATPEVGSLLEELARRLTALTGAAVTVGYGPRFLHSTGQLHKGGTPGGWFLQLVDRPTTDLPVPETDHTYGRIVAAQADGDFQALLEAGRDVRRVDLGRDRLGGLAELVETLS
jgi:transaldolase/glucose-6-phosphate isomerase